MSFKSKQRMKHSHLFGDDPLNASSTSLASDDPLFGSSATTGRSSGRATPSDPLSTRSSRPSSPSSLFEPSSASGSPRLNAKRLTNGTSSHSGSIFGDIDVSKLGGNGIFNGKKSASLRASASSTLRNVDDDDEDALFGGGGSSSPSRSGSRGVVASAASAASATARPSLSSASSTSTRSSASDIERKPVQPTIPPSAPKKQPPPPPPTSASSTPPLRKENETTTNAIPEVQSNRSTGSSSLFSRFIKSKPSTPTGSGQASPIERQHQDRSAPPLAETTSLTPGTTMKRTSTKAPPPPVPPRQFPSSSPDPSNSVSTQKLEQKRPVVEEDYEEEEEEEENAPAVVIEDEATRAFAEDVHFDTPTYKLPSTYDDPEILASLTNDTLRLDDRPPMTPSISTPAVAYSQQQRSPLNDMYSEALNPWSSLGGPSIDRLFSRTASTSSPLLKNEQKVKISEIDPSKRSAFADLIDSWNGKQRIEKRDTRPDELFFNKVAEEQRDIGFAGLDGNDKVTTQSFEGDTRNWNIVDNDNPWR